MHRTILAAALAALTVAAAGCGPLIRTSEPVGAEVPVVTELPGFAFVVDVDEAGGRIAVDPAEWLTGAEAAEAARAAGDLGEGETEVPNGYYIRNAEVEEVWLPLDAASTVFVMTNPGDPTTETEVDAAGLATFVDQNPVSPFQLTYTSGGLVEELRFVYRP